MRSIFWGHTWAHYVFRRHGNSSTRRPRTLLWKLAEELEPRCALSSASAALPPIQMLSATTTDSKSVTIDYRVNQTPDATNPIQFGIYRSSNSQFDSSAVLIDTFTPTTTSTASAQAPLTLDQSGQPATAVGMHELTIPLPDGLPPYPEKPYVLVVADPSSPLASANAEQAASFRTYTIAIVTHGGIQDTSWKHGPPWELEIAYMMRHEGYDAVIAYNWVNQSNTPGAAIEQSPRLARIILNRASDFPASAPVNLDFIGHSEGTVVNAYAIQRLQGMMLPQLKAGYIVDTMLDPHAANNDLPGKQYSTAGPLAELANIVVSDYQGSAGDPPAYFPSIVDEAQVFFQHSAATASSIYNLWGQVPVRSDGPVVHYYNLTAMGATHSGEKGVNYWYRDFVAPTLGYQAPLIQELQLNGQIDNTTLPAAITLAATATPGHRTSLRETALLGQNRIYGPAQVVASSQPEFSGTAAPDSVVRLYVGPAAKPQEIGFAGSTVANSSGQWSLSTRRPLPSGQYRAVVTSFSRALRTRPGLTIVPTQPLGRFVVPAS